jgi:alpha-methylacyl-CoA racemase
MSPVLDGLRVLELGGIGPVPHAAMMLADLGADVVRVERPKPGVALIEAENDYVLRNRRVVAADLKSRDGLDLALSLADRADILLEGFRPGTAERLGLGPAVCLERNPRLIYGRMTGWGQGGPMARSAGHDINYLAASGALHSSSTPERAPHPSLNLVADLGGGSMLVVTGVLAALYERERSGAGQVIDAAMIDGVSALMASYWNLSEFGRWSAPGTNLTDGGAPFYRTYRCADGRFVAVGAVEPEFYRALVRGLGLDPDELPDQNDAAAWPGVTELFAERFAGATRDEWTARFAGTDACLTPVLELAEAYDQPQIRARETIVTASGRRQPAPAPRFSRSPAPALRPPSVPGADIDAVRADWGL